ncbi:surface antigen [Bordetella pertussis]|nr:surface antigen [Bordetella pertussis]
MSTRDFLLAHMTHSLAEVDAETAQVRLSVEIDSGPAVRMGALQTDGLQRVPRWTRARAAARTT